MMTMREETSTIVSGGQDCLGSLPKRCITPINSLFNTSPDRVVDTRERTVNHRDSRIEIRESRFHNRDSRIDIRE